MIGFAISTPFPRHPRIFFRSLDFLEPPISVAPFDRTLRHATNDRLARTIFLSIFVLMTQSRESKIGELREELTLQVNLRMEEEITKTLHLVAGLYSRLGLQLADDPELKAMLEPLDPKRMETDLAEQISASMPQFKLSAYAPTKCTR